MEFHKTVGTIKNLCFVDGLVIATTRDRIYVWTLVVALAPGTYIVLSTLDITLKFSVSFRRMTHIITVDAVDHDRPPLEVAQIVLADLW